VEIGRSIQLSEEGWHTPCFLPETLGDLRFQKSSTLDISIQPRSTRRKIMRRERRSHIIVAVVIAISLALGGIAEAGGRLALGGPMTPKPTLRSEADAIAQGLSWLAELWSGFRAVFSEETTDSAPPECAPNTTCGDAGPGIDPEG